MISSHSSDTPTPTQPSSKSSFLLRATAASSHFRILAIDSSALVLEAQQRHNLSPDASAALGRLMTGAVLFSYILVKHENSRVMLRIQGDGPLGYVVAEGSSEQGKATARGYVQHPEVELPLRLQDGKLDVRALIGAGDLGVSRLLPGSEPYTSSVPLVSGEIAEDLAHYLMHSEQIPSALLLGVYLEGGSVHTAGGILVQAMPEASEADLKTLERNIADVGNLTHALQSASLLEVVTRVTEGLSLELLEEATPLTFECRCSRERLVAAMGYFSAEERQEMIEQGGQEAICHWCNTHYQLTAQEIASLE